MKAELKKNENNPWYEETNATLDKMEEDTEISDLEAKLADLEKKEIRTMRIRT